MIHSHGLSAGDALPSYRQLTRLLGVGLVTVHEAMTLLAQRKVVHVKKGCRTTVGPGSAELTNRLTEVGLVYAGSRAQFTNHDYLIQILRGVLLESENVNADVRIICTGKREHQIRAKEVDATGLDGIICVGSLSSSPHYHDYIRDGISTVVADGLTPDLPLDCVVCDNDQAGAEIIPHLVELGHRRTAYVEGQTIQYSKDRRPESSDTYERREAYRHAMEAAGLLPQILRSPIGRPEEYEEYPLWLASLPERIKRLKEPPTALVAYDVLTARSLIERLELVGVKVPGDISVVAMAGSPGDATAGSRTISYCSFDFLEMGRQSMLILAGLCRQHRRPRIGPRVKRIGCTLIRGETVAPPAG